MRKLFALTLILFVVPISAQEVDTSGIKLNPGEILLSVDGVPVNQTEPQRTGPVLKTLSKAKNATARAIAGTRNIVGNLVRTGRPFSHTPGNSAMEKVNYERRLNGQGPLRIDPALHALALKKATIAAQRGYKNHIGGTLGGAKSEGVGYTNGRFLSCCLDMPATYGGAAMVQGRDGWYCCLLVR